MADIGNKSENIAKLFEVSLEHNTKNISEEIFEKIRHLILMGGLPEGFVFPNENELCQKLNVGRSSLREAFTALETLRLIKRKKTGTCVCKRTSIQNTMNLEYMARFMKPEDVMNYRIIIEVGAATMASEVFTKDDIERLQEINERMEHAEDDAILQSKYDFDFHFCLVESAHNDLLIYTFNSIRKVYEAFTSKVFTKGALEVSIGDHQKIINSLKAKDKENLVKNLRQHLSNAEAIYFSRDDKIV